MKKNQINKKILITLIASLFISVTFNVLWWFGDRPYILGQIDEFQESSSFDYDLMNKMNDTLETCGQYVIKSGEIITDITDNNYTNADKLALEAVELIEKMEEQNTLLNQEFLKREENMKNYKFLKKR
jgi:hypothetical protein